MVEPAADRHESNSAQFSARRQVDASAIFDPVVDSVPAARTAELQGDGPDAPANLDADGPDPGRQADVGVKVTVGCGYPWGHLKGYATMQIGTRRQLRLRAI